MGLYTCHSLRHSFYAQGYNILIYNKRNNNKRLLA